MSEEVIVRLGAPTLAGIKTGSLFTCAYTSRKSVEESLRQLNRCFAPKGLCLLPLILDILEDIKWARIKSRA